MIANNAVIEFFFARANLHCANSTISRFLLFFLSILVNKTCIIVKLENSRFLMYYTGRGIVRISFIYVYELLTMSINAFISYVEDHIYGGRIIIYLKEDYIIVKLGCVVVKYI